jgi:hypothetical protein
MKIRLTLGRDTDHLTVLLGWTRYTSMFSNDLKFKKIMSRNRLVPMKYFSVWNLLVQTWYNAGTIFVQSRTMTEKLLIVYIHLCKRLLISWIEIYYIIKMTQT